MEVVTFNLKKGIIIKNGVFWDVNLYTQLIKAGKIKRSLKVKNKCERFIKRGGEEKCAKHAKRLTRLLLESEAPAPPKICRTGMPFGGKKGMVLH